MYERSGAKRSGERGTVPRDPKTCARSLCRFGAAEEFQDRVSGPQVFFITSSGVQSHVRRSQNVLAMAKGGRTAEFRMYHSGFDLVYNDAAINKDLTSTSRPLSSAAHFRAAAAADLAMRLASSSLLAFSLPTRSAEAATETLFSAMWSISWSCRLSM